MEILDTFISIIKITKDSEGNIEVDQNWDQILK